ncbi:hypothetical protein, variant 1 [Aphanomyces invadans]|uniref:Myosin motor domain-containing protein n=1 Tax=Aphanomyces invadans TaxID=157072 RepID=A0A024TN28_9STRA|nr:hypothetical protein, variant 1 [Aphanomyces invadans]ETV95393.1 hypothetical protein, variant 1 [Aphanomyces invadans]|eukprot:XP_008876094.1 hypothetical protein, variant 1 [Aphanomyces invadans]
MATTAKKARREGEKVWCPDPRNVWQLGSIVEDDGDSLFVLTPDDNEEHKFNVSQTHPFDPSHSLLLPNVSDMDNLHEAPLLDLLRRRYMEDLIYTFTGDILISINPYKNIPLLYNFPDIGSLSKQENPTPHVYVTADGAYRALQNTGKCQSILVSGESGAGKTEAAKYIMRYLANISQSSKSPNATGGGGSVEQCVLQSNPLLEAFGNAKTIRNDNSSRFGKFIKINYDRDGKICGASTSHFLLEKSRIVGCSENERNYHIFYQICSGLNDAERAALHLERADDYVYLNQGNCIQCPEVNDKKSFKELVDAMDVMGITPEVKHNIFTLVASVLHLGNLQFVENAKNEATCPDKKQVQVLASLLQVTPKELEFALCMRTVSAGARGSVAEICLSGVDAGKSRNGLAKAIYSAMFDWLVDRINVATAQMTGATTSTTMGDTGPRFIGILDIFGFEILAVNSFEQLCINYTNEMLQQQFNQHVFVYEQDVYVEEGIDWSKLSFQDNIPCLELIEKKPLGILILLDEQALMGRRASDDNFIQKLHQTHEKHPNYIKPRFGKEDFIIKHYAGQVTYKVAGFLDKNNDSLHNDLLDLTNSSRMAFLHGLFSPAGQSPSEQKLKRASMTKMTGTMTVGRKFREQMTELMQQLNTTTPAFVRCVKPNNLRFPQGWNAELILNQLIYLGVMETVRIRRSGFPVRRTFAEFFEKYKLLHKVYAAKTKSNPKTDKEKCELILTHAVERDNWQLGHKKVFMRDSQLRLLDAVVRKVRVEAAVVVQKYVRRFLQRKLFLHIRAAIVKVQSKVRMFVARKKFRRMRHRITLLNACVRRYLARRRFLRMKRAAISIQAGERGRKARALARYLRAAPKAQTAIARRVRGFLARKRFVTLKQSGFVVKASIQAFFHRQRYLRLRKAAIAISKSVKRFVACKRYARQRKAAIRIHAVGRGFLARLKYGKKARIRAQVRAKAQTAISRYHPLCVLYWRLDVDTDFLGRWPLLFAASFHPWSRRMVRGYLGRLHYRVAKRCIVMVQARWRANRVRTLYIQGRQATIASQAMIRRSLARRKFLREKKMATRLCAFGRMIIARRAYLTAKRQIVLVQSLVRRYLQGKHYRHLKRQFVLVQAMWRRKQCVKTYQRQRWAIIKIQSLGKMIPCRRRLHNARKAATTIASGIRMFLARRRYRKSRAAFVKLQARWRSFVAKRHYLAQVDCIIKVQSVVRSKLARKHMQTQRRGLLRVLSLMRKYLARIRLHKKIDQMFAAAHAFDLSTILAMAQDKEFPNATMVRVRDKHNHMRSLVHIAAINGDLNLARFVLSEIPNMEDQVIGRDNLGNTPLHYASRLVHLDMVKYLAKIVNRINPMQDNAKQMPLGRKYSSPVNVSSSPVHGSSSTLRKDSSFSQTPRSPVGSTALRSPSNANVGPGGKPKRRALVSSASVMPPNPTAQAAVELPPDTTKVLKEGPLRTASGAKMASKRHVVLDENVLALYKSANDRIPVKMIELRDVTLRRATAIENCFDILSPRLKCAKDPYGIVSFVADTEADVHEWMKAIREVPMVRIGTLVPPNPSMICIDWSNRKEWINAKNNQHESALHLAVQNQEDEGFEAVKTAVWLIENDADINAKDRAGNTPLHYAVQEERDDLVESLLKKGALTTIANNAGLTPLDCATEQSTKDLLAPGAIVSVPQDRFNLLPRPTGPNKVNNATYVSVLLSAVAIAGAVMLTPHFRIYVMDVRGNIVDTPQYTPDALIQDGPSLWFGNTWHLQVPLEHMTEGCVAVFELLRYACTPSAGSQHVCLA